MSTEHYISILSFVHKNLLETGCSVLVNHKVHVTIGVIMDATDPLVTMMKSHPHPPGDLHRYWED